MHREASAEARLVKVNGKTRKDRRQEDVDVPEERRKTKPVYVDWRRGHAKK